MFQLSLAAYRLNDLTFLQELYINLAVNNLWWRCSNAAHNYMKQELERPAVSLQRLRTRPEFQNRNAPSLWERGAGANLCQPDGTRSCPTPPGRVA
ncbi:hypothetical protein [Ralstonia phage phiRSL1]|uniref:Uncharacterized protein n=1 Tax=Ralstonia phage phiRSL1 TaxID=1980924 RepID=B2ZYJ6_9CAUD|nr:hypothetical protein RSL1_ORF325 [Ralstonia phage phiRSL1]BAG41772.2 hypothetical protein [Ralstonia phage phiRSL1]